MEGMALFVAFPASIAMAMISLWHVQDTRDLLIAAVSLTLSALIWAYHFVSLRETPQPLSAPEPLLQPPPEVKSARTSASPRKANTPADELYTRGRIAYLRGSLDEAKDCFETILKKDSKDSDAAFQLARIYRQLGDRRQAERFFRQCQETPGGAKWSEEIKKYLEGNKS